jgi:hypothetical protein
LLVLFVLLTYREPVTKLLQNLESLTLPGGFRVSLRNAVELAARTVIEDNPNALKEVTPQQVAAAEQIERLAVQYDPLAARQEMIGLAREYQRLRAALPSSDERTRRAEIIVTKMRTLALACIPFLQEFTQSANSGERLAAAAILQVSPEPKYVDWLARRFKEDAPFIGYQAAVALFMAARAAEPAERAAIEKAILSAKTALEPVAE